MGLIWGEFFFKLKNLIKYINLKDIIKIIEKKDINNSQFRGIICGIKKYNKIVII